MGQVSFRALHAPKEGNSEEQYEDALAVSPLEDTDGRFTVALADGASSAVFARQWANLLVKEFTATVDAFPDEDAALPEIIEKAGRVWRSSVEEKATSWYAQEKLPNGSSAALLVATWDIAARKVVARAVGDVCLFIVRGEKLKYAFPHTKSRQFNDRPELLSTEAMPVGKTINISRFDSAYEPGDRFLLMTDALAAYFLAECEARHKPWNALASSKEALPVWLKVRRDDGKLKNDDVTLIDITL